MATPEYAVTLGINSDGTVDSVTQAGRTTGYEYDLLGRLMKVHSPGNTNFTEIRYVEESGAIVRTETQRGSSLLISHLDGFGRPLTTINAANVSMSREYDAEGRVIYEGYPVPTGAQSFGTAISYDALGRETSRVNPDTTGSTTTYGSGGLTIVTEYLGLNLPPRSTALIAQAFGDPDGGHVVQVTDAAGSDWAYSYNAVGRLTGVLAEDGMTRTWEFTNNLLTREVHPESGTTTYTYDVAGQLYRKTDANGTTTTFERDGNDRVTRITAGNRVTTITYEPGSDNRVAAVNPFAGIMWRYDLSTGRLQDRQDSIDSKLFTTAYEYDANDNLKAIQYPSGRRVDYDVNDAAGRPTRVYEAAASRDYAANIQYHSSGGVLSYTTSNGIGTTIEYDPARYWVKQIEAGPMLLTYDNYDGVGNPHTIHDARPSFGQSFEYDVLDRLTAATGVYGAADYAYDLHGNRVSTGGATYQYQVGTLRLSNQNGTGFEYDNNGNTITVGNAQFAYSPQNQIESATVPGSVTTYVYDADDQRVKKTSGTTTTYYVRGLGGELLSEWTDPGTATGRVRDYIYLGSRLLSAVARNTTEDPAGFTRPSTASHRLAKSWQVTNGMGTGAALLNGPITAAARKSFHPDMPATGLRVGVQNAGTIDRLTLNANLNSSADAPRQGGLFVEFEIERYPTAAKAEWLAVDGSGTLVPLTDDLRVYVSPAGYVIVEHDGGRATPQTIATSPTVIDLFTRHTLELRFGFNSYTGPYVAPNPVWENLNSWAEVYLDGESIGTYQPDGLEVYGLDVKNGSAYYTAAEIKSPGPSAGLLMSLSRVAVTGAQNAGDAFERYGAAWRSTLLEAGDNGTYSQWAGGQSDWRARSILPYGSGPTESASTTVSGQKVSYRIESMLSKGITGNIGAVFIGVRMGSVSTNSKAFFRRNGVETILTALTLTANNNTWYRVATSGWSPTDTIEIGVVSGGNTTTNLASVALLVEHDTPEPAPLTDTAVRVVKVNYVGNGGAQTIDLGVAGLVPTALFVMQSNGASLVEPLWWWDSRVGASSLSQVATNYGRIWPQKGKFHAVHTASKSYNADGVSYTAIALFDPSGRFVIPFAVSKPPDESYTHYLRYPESGALASDFTPDFVFGGVASSSGAADTAGASVYRGPGHVGDLTGKLGVTPTSSASVPDRITALGAGTVAFGTALGGHTNGDQAYWAGRVDDGVSSTRLMAVTSYVGDGTASRNIALALGNQAPVLAFVVPTNATAKVYRVEGDSTGRVTYSSNSAPNSITAMSANQITVGTALNANGVTYDVWTITTGTVTPW